MRVPQRPLLATAVLLGGLTFVPPPAQAQEPQIQGQPAAGEEGTGMGSMWLLPVVGGPILLGAILAYGAIRRRRRRGETPPR
jgi:LPXTG-motif cell wall-anchored protein